MQVTYASCLEGGHMTKLKIKKGTSVIYGKQLVKVFLGLIFVCHLFVASAFAFPCPKGCAAVARRCRLAVSAIGEIGGCCAGDRMQRREP